MYIPKSFAVTDNKTINHFIDNNSFGQLISNHQGRLFTSYLPFLYDATAGQLIGHVAKANPQHQDLEGQELLVSIQGAHGYVSPAWYQSKSVPTWNYQTAQIYGQATVFNDPHRLKDVVDSLAAKYESSLPNPWVPEYQVRQLNGIIGIDIKITAIECKFKMNQNRTQEDIQGVIDHLDPVKQIELLQAMKQANKPSLKT